MPADTSEPATPDTPVRTPGRAGDLTRLPQWGITQAAAAARRASQLATAPVGAALAAVGEGPLAGPRRNVAIQVRRMVIGGDTEVRDLSEPLQGDPGLFGPDSVTWRVHADSSMFVGGLRALLLQTMHPLAMAGVAEHSAYRSDPLGRLRRTANYVGLTTFGTTEQADEMVAMVRRVHEQVRGTAPDGRPYDANDPHLLLWVHHALVDSFLRTYQRYGAAPLSDADADQYVAEMAVMAERLGAEPAATSVAGLEAWFSRERPVLGATPDARRAAWWLMVPPLPLAVRPTYAVIAAAAVGSLPAWVRRQLRLPVAPGADPLVVRPATTLLLRSLDWVMAAHPPPPAATTGDGTAS